MQIEPVSLFGRGAPPILARMFWPPPRFDAEMEAEYRADSLRRWIVARQVAVVLIAGFWISYFGWDWFHAYRNEDFRPTLGNILILRGIGTLIVATAVLDEPVPSLTETLIVRGVVDGLSEVFSNCTISIAFA